MEILQHLTDGFLIAFEPLNLMLVIIGVVVGLSSAPCRAWAR